MELSGGAGKCRIVDSNRIMLISLLRTYIPNAEIVDGGIAGDTMEALQRYRITLTSYPYNVFFFLNDCIL